MPRWRTNRLSRHKLRGVNSTVCAGFASGLFAMHYAAEFLRFGRAKVLLAGGVEELCEESALGFRKTGAASQSGCVRPFAGDRDGVAPGEGSALWTLESEEAALARGRAPWFEVQGFGCVQDAHRIDGFDMRGLGAAEAMEQALADADITVYEVACIIASASGSPAGDEMEARALERVFGETLPEIPLCAPKAAFGEAAGASGALSAVVAGMALQRQSLPPTAGHNGDRNGLRLSSNAQPAFQTMCIKTLLAAMETTLLWCSRLWKN